MKFFRPHRGVFDVWRRYEVFVDGRGWRLHTSQLLEVPPTAGELEIRIGPYRLPLGRVTPAADETLVVRLAGRPGATTPPIKATWMSRDLLATQVFSFNRPPYVGPRPVRIASGLAAVGAFVITGLGLIPLLLAKAISLFQVGDLAGVVFLATAGTFLALSLLAIAAASLKGLYYWRQLPPDLRDA